MSNLRLRLMCRWAWGLLLVLLGLRSATAIANDVPPRPVSGAGVATVLELAFVDDAGTVSERETIAVRVLSDGSVLLPAPEGTRLIVRDRLTPRQLEMLLEDVVTRSSLATVDSHRLEGSVRAACHAAGLVPDVPGAAATIIRHRTPASAGEIRCTALSLAAARFPDMADVQRVFDTQLRLQNVAAVAQAGGVQASERLAAIANRELRSSHPHAPTVTSQDLSMVRELSSGCRYIQFYRRVPQPGEELLVGLFETPGEPPRVDVLSMPSAP